MLSGRVREWEKRTRGGFWQVKANRTSNPRSLTKAFYGAHRLGSNVREIARETKGARQSIGQAGDD